MPTQAEVSALCRTIGDGWYKEEVGGKGFDLPDLTDREDAGERAVFDIKRRTTRLSGDIGANWYHDTSTLTIDDLATRGYVFINGLKFDALDDPEFTFPPPKTKPLSLYKPLPPLPKFENEEATVAAVADVSLDKDWKVPAATHINGAHFDYMFADADETKVTTIHDDDQDSLVLAEMVEDEDDADPEDVGPSTPLQVFHQNAQATPTFVHQYPMQASSTQVFYHHQAQDSRANEVLDLSDFHANALPLAGIPNTTNANLAAPLVVDEHHEVDKVQATHNFFEGPVEESPSPYHAPLIDGETGYGDFRKGYEDFPQLWRHDEPQHKTITIEDSDKVVSSVLEHVPEVIDTALTITAPLPKLNPNNGLASLADHAKARKAKKAAELAKIETIETTPILIDLTVEENASETSSITKKRRARSSFATKSTCDDADDDIKYLYTKKIRVNTEQDNDEVFSDGRPSTYSLITQPEDDDATFQTITNTGLFSRISGAKGFLGQFEGRATTEQTTRAKKLHVAKVPVYMGQATHLNNVILHKDIHVCPTFEDTEYTPTSAPVDSDLGRCLTYGDEYTDLAAAMVRVPGEEALRTEAHRECATARLEGVAVGLYRYFQGHLTVEEYHERRMCICWQMCECSKLCTRFADLLCPCADKIETNCH